MPYVFVGDGAPEAADYDSSWLHYDEDDLASMEVALGVVESRGGGRRTGTDAATRALRQAVARKRAMQRAADAPRRKLGLLARFARLLVSRSNRFEQPTT